MRTGITGRFGVPGENNNGRRVIHFCAEGKLSVSNTYFEHRMIGGEQSYAVLCA